MITWDELDQCQGEDEIADMLRTAGIRGIPQTVFHCALARALGQGVEISYTRNGLLVGDHKLTAAESDFIRAFDNHEYPDLEMNDAERLTR